jgi:hypothetical protein
VLGLCAILGVTAAVLGTAVLVGQGVMPEWAAAFEDEYSRPFYAQFHAHPVRESVWAALEVVALMPIGFALRRWGLRLRGAEAGPSPAGYAGRIVGLQAFWRSDGVRDALAVVCLALLPFAWPLLRHCGGDGQGRMPDAWPDVLLPYDLSRTCAYVAQGATDGGSHHLGVIVVAVGLTLAALLRLGSIARRARGWFGRA